MYKLQQKGRVIHMKKGIKYLVSIIIAVMIFILATNIFAIEKSSYTDATQTRQGKTYF